MPIYNPNNNTSQISGGSELLAVNPVTTPTTVQPTITAPVATTPIVQTSSLANENKASVQGFLDWAKTNLSAQAQNAATTMMNDKSTQSEKDAALLKAQQEQQRIDNETKKVNALTGEDDPGTGKEDTTGVKGKGYWSYSNGKKKWNSTDGTNSGSASTIEDENAQALQDFQDMTDDMRNGTIPLNPLQQAQLDALRKNFESLITAQKEANKQYEGAIVQSGITGGRSRYAPEIEAGNVFNSIQVGIAKVAELDSKMAGALAQMEMGFQENNYKLVQASYDAFTDAQKIKQENLDKIADDMAEALKQTNEANAKVTAELEKTRTEVLMKAKEGGAPTSILQAITDAEDVANIVNSAGDYLQGTSGIVGEYNFYARQAREKGQTPVDFNTYQNIDANRKAKAAAAANGSGYSPTILTKVESQAGKFGTEQTVKDYNTVASQLGFMKTLGVTPTDDIARVYVFAKIMDPNSVVREGEYKTVQDYSQALLQAFGLKTKRVFSNTGFLTTEARGFLENTLDKKLKATEMPYKNLVNEYGRKIDKITGGTDGKEFLTDYSAGYNSPANDLVQQEAAAETKVVDVAARNPQANVAITEMLKMPGITYSDIIETLPEYFK